MKLSPMKDILEMAEERNIAYGAYVTVSYETALAAIEAGTELDIPVIFITGTDCCDSVSYTHLDVYKRQTWGCGSCRASVISDLM